MAMTSREFNHVAARLTGQQASIIVKTGRANPGVAQWAQQVDAPVACRSAGLHGPDPRSSAVAQQTAP
jgi:phage tail protein X